MERIEFMKLTNTLTLTVLFAFAALTFAPRAEAFQTFSNANGTAYAWNVNTSVKWQVVGDAPQIVREAMLYSTNTWSAATSGKLTFEEGPGGISIEWDAEGSKIIDTLYLAYTTFNADAKFKIFTSRIVVNASTYGWQRGGYTGVGPMVNGKREANLDSVMLHELGHALGLDHSDRNSAAIVGTAKPGDLPTMNSIIYPGAETLHLDDESGVRALYNAEAAAPITIAIGASPSTGTAPLNVSLNQNTGSNEAQWDFGDGSFGRGANVSHKYTTPGVYTVTVNANGKTGTTTITVDKKGKAKAPKPVRKPRKERAPKAPKLTKTLNVSYSSEGFENFR
jgi:PKD repeat protein